MKSKEGWCPVLQFTIDTGYISLSNQVTATFPHCLELLVIFAFPLTFVCFFDIIPSVVVVQLELKAEKHKYTVQCLKTKNVWGNCDYFKNLPKRVGIPIELKLQ
jgi:hypothetical protein